MAFVDGFLLQHLANPHPDDEARLRDGLQDLFAAAQPTTLGGAR
jgi:hypothetical protein